MKGRYLSDDLDDFLDGEDLFLYLGLCVSACVSFSTHELFSVINYLINYFAFVILKVSHFNLMLLYIFSCWWLIEANVTQPHNLVNPENQSDESDGKQQHLCLRLA